MVDIVKIAPFENKELLLIRHVPTHEYLEIKHTKYFYYGNRYHRYNWNDQFPIKIEPKKKDRRGYPLINILKLYIPIMQKEKMNLVVYVESYLLKDADKLLPPPIIIIDTKHIRQKI